MVVAFDFVCSSQVDSKSPTEAKLTFQQKVDSLQRSNRDIEDNTIAGSSDYVSDSTSKRANGSQRVHFDETASSIALNTTSSQANVFQATAPVNGSHQRDPLLVNAQSPNPFLSNVPGGVNPQIAMLMQNNPRLQMLARQNPIVAQQILRNPALLRDPQINRMEFLPFFLEFFSIGIAFLFRSHSVAVITGSRTKLVRSTWTGWSFERSWPSTESSRVTPRHQFRITESAAR